MIAITLEIQVEEGRDTTSWVEMMRRAKGSERVADTYHILQIPARMDRVNMTDVTDRDKYSYDSLIWQTMLTDHSTSADPGILHHEPV